MKSSIFSFDITNAVVPNPKTLLLIPASAVATVNPNGMSTLLASVVSIFLAHVKPVFNNDSRRFL